MSLGCLYPMNVLPLAKRFEPRPGRLPASASQNPVILKESLTGKGCSPFTGAEIREADAYCKDRFIELVPSFASFGHFHDILTQAPYRHMAEDLGNGTYSKKDLDQNLLSTLKKGWTLVPGRE